MKSKEILLWTAIGILTVAALVGTYAFNLSAPIIALIWLGWFLPSAAFFYFTEKGRQTFSFAKEAKLELDKVVWPTRQETTQTTLIVIVMVSVTGFVLWGVDATMMWAIGKITQLG